MFDWLFPVEEKKEKIPKTDSEVMNEKIRQSNLKFMSVRRETHREWCKRHGVSQSE